MEEEAELVGARLGARGAVGGEMRLPGFDMVFGLTASAIELLVEPARAAGLEAGDDEARVSSLGAGLDAGDDPLDPAPAGGAVIEVAVAAQLAGFGSGREELLRAVFKSADMTAQGRAGGDAQNVVDAVGAAPIEHQRAAIMAVAAQQDLGLRPVGADGAQQAPQQGNDLGAARPFGGTQHSGDEAAFAVEHDDGLEAVFIVMGVEQPQLLSAVNGIERVDDIEHDALGNPRERAAV